MLDLFTEPQPLSLDGAEITYYPTPDLGTHPDALFEQLRQEIPWERHKVVMHGMVIDQPRLSSWYGEVAHTYETLAHQLIPHQWSPLLAALKHSVEVITGATYNSMLANLYRNGEDYIGWHSDDESELGPFPTIASISLGTERFFNLRRKDQHHQSSRILLAHGSLLLMSGKTQREWQHSIHKCRRSVSERINLTFRLTQPRLNSQPADCLPSQSFASRHLEP